MRILSYYPEAPTLRRLAVWLFGVWVFLLAARQTYAFWQDLNSVDLWLIFEIITFSYLGLAVLLITRGKDWLSFFYGVACFGLAVTLGGTTNRVIDQLASRSADVLEFLLNVSIYFAAELIAARHMPRWGLCLARILVLPAYAADLVLSITLSHAPTPLTITLRLVPAGVVIAFFFITWIHTQQSSKSRIEVLGLPLVIRNVGFVITFAPITDFFYLWTLWKFLVLLAFVRAAPSLIRIPRMTEARANYARLLAIIGVGILTQAFILKNELYARSDVDSRTQGVVAGLVIERPAKKKTIRRPPTFVYYDSREEHVRVALSTSSSNGHFYVILSDIVPATCRPGNDLTVVRPATYLRVVEPVPYSTSRFALEKIYLEETDSRPFR